MVNNILDRVPRKHKLMRAIFVEEYGNQTLRSSTYPQGSGGYQLATHAKRIRLTCSTGRGISSRLTWNGIEASYDFACSARCAW